MRRLPMVFQADTNECALACCAMLLGFHGSTCSLSSLRSRFMAKSGAVTVSELIDMTKTLGFTCRALRCEITELNRITLPAIIHWDFDHYVVLKSVSRRTMAIHDPAVGERRIGKKVFSQHFTGVVLEAIPDSAHIAPDIPEAPVNKFDYIGPRTGLLPAMVQLLILTLVLQLLTLGMPLFMQLVVDEVLLPNDVNLLTVLVLGFTGLALVTLLANALQALTGLYLASRMSIQMSGRLFSHLVRLRTDYFQTRHMGDIVSRFQSFSALQDFISSSLVNLLLNGLLIVTTLSMLFFYSTWLGALVFLFILLIALGKVAFYWPLRHRTQEQIVRSAMLDSHFMESVRNISAVQRFNAEGTSESEYINRQIDVTNASVRVGHIEISYNLFSTGFRSIVYIIVVYLLAKSVLSGEFTLGMLYAFLAYFDRTTSAVEAFTSEVLKGLMLSLHLDRLSDITQAEGNVLHDRQLKLENAPARALMVHNGSFSYKGMPVFSRLNLSLPPGQHLAIFGPSGSGKTTFIKVVQGLLPLDTGEVVLNDHLLCNENQKMLADRTASVMQEDQLLSGTMLENITFRDPRPEFEKAVHCCKQVLLHDEIMAHPLGYDRKVYEMDPSLSSGQCQKLLLARALYRDPAVLFLDEGTAHLDRETAVAVMRNILAMRITCVYSTHMIECVSFASLILETGSQWTVRKNTERSTN